MNTSKPSVVIGEGRVVMRDHPALSTAAAELLHTLDSLEDGDRLKARAYLLHVYGIAAGCHPSTRRLEQLDTWANDRNALAAASGHLLAVERVLDETDPLGIASGLHAAALLEVAHRG